MSDASTEAAQGAAGGNLGRVVLTVRVRDKDGRIKADGVQLEGTIESARLLLDDYVEVSDNGSPAFGAGA